MLKVLPWRQSDRSLHWDEVIKIKHITDKDAEKKYLIIELDRFVNLHEVLYF